MNRLVLLLAFATTAFAQPRVVNAYMATCSFSLSAEATACTIQQPASGARNVQLVSAYIESSAAINISQERNGSAATTTSVTPTAVNPDQTDAAVATVFHTSNVGSGTVLGGAGTTILVVANSGLTLDLQDIQLRGSGTSKNYTIKVAAATATGRIILKWREY